MEEDDPRRPLLGVGVGDGAGPTSRWRRLCTAECWRQRLPITHWLPRYTLHKALRDAIAGTTVALTAIPQGIAYAIIAGLPPQVGLYSSIFPGLVYAVFGSCPAVTIGPTAVLAALLRPYVQLSPDFAYLAALLAGVFILLLGLLQLGFLLDFVSKPVISGFTTAAAMQIGSAQLKALFRITGSSGNTFVTAIINLFNNIKHIQLWDTLLGLSCMAALIALKAVSFGGGRLGALWQSVKRARNAVVVVVAALVAYALALHGLSPLALTGPIAGGLPAFGLPPFSTTVSNHTLTFPDMLETFGVRGLVLPLVAVLESIAIARAFAGGARVDATQEMVALGLCNVVSSCCQCMPATGSFTRTALNHASGVATQAGALYKALVVLLALSLLSSSFSYIPRAALAAVILVAMGGLVDYRIAPLLYRHNKSELLVWLVTVTVGCSAGLEYGILAGVLGDVLRVLHASATPVIHSDCCKEGSLWYRVVWLQGRLQYGGVARVAAALRPQRAGEAVLLDGAALIALDIGVAESIISTIVESEAAHKTHYTLWQWGPHCRRLMEELRPSLAGRFRSDGTIQQLVRDLDTTRAENIPIC